MVKTYYGDYHYYVDTETDSTVLFEGIWALHTTVIRAADLREARNLVRNRAPKSTHAANFAEMFCFPTNLSAYAGPYKVFH